MLLLQRSLQLGCTTVRERLESACSVVRLGCERRLRLDTALCQCQKIPLQLFGSFALQLQRRSHGRRRFPGFNLLAELTRPAVICVFCARRRQFVRHLQELPLRLLLFRRSRSFGRQCDKETYRRQEYCLSAPAQVAG